MSRTADEAGLDKDSEQSAPAQDPKLTLSSTFCASDADIELRSKDGTRYLVHRANLGASSTMLAEMFASVPAETQGARPVIQLEESATVLDRMLPYCYPRKVPSLQLEETRRAGRWKSDDLPLLAAFDKYEIWRGIEAFIACYDSIIDPHFLDRDVSKWPTLDAALIAFAMSKHFDSPELANRSRIALIEASPCKDNLEKVMRDVELGPLAASADIDRILLHTFSYLHSIGRIHKRCRKDYLRALEEHGHSNREEDNARCDQAWDNLEDYVTPEGIPQYGSGLEDWQCAACRDALNRAREELLTSARKLAAEHADRW
ncbi:hypothetical protein BCR35DRAFT_307536 [Leucosporidium creatinivorum]|uniref:BTB domain-containing protein n=1 Tax=Leucosporidium creatinivorum TaxID=106004 RepID=A0A1Y2EMJ9_9BASI|nr:hypothetical protein BCR35DRAFT_307536 [Leucosporidium creatinivorum]